MSVRYFLYLLSSRKKVEFQSRIDGLKQYMELRSVENKLQGFCLTQSEGVLFDPFKVEQKWSSASDQKFNLNLEQN